MKFLDEVKYRFLMLFIPAILALESLMCGLAFAYLVPNPELTNIYAYTYFIFGSLLIINYVVILVYDNKKRNENENR